MINLINSISVYHQVLTPCISNFPIYTPGYRFQFTVPFFPKFPDQRVFQEPENRNSPFFSKDSGRFAYFPLLIIHAFKSRMVFYFNGKKMTGSWFSECYFLFEICFFDGTFIYSVFDQGISALSVHDQGCNEIAIPVGHACTDLFYGIYSLGSQKGF